MDKNTKNGLMFLNENDLVTIRFDPKHDITAYELSKLFRILCKSITVPSSYLPDDERVLRHLIIEGKDSEIRS